MKNRFFVLAIKVFLFRVVALKEKIRMIPRDKSGFAVQGS